MRMRACACVRACVQAGMHAQSGSMANRQSVNQPENRTREVLLDRVVQAVTTAGPRHHASELSSTGFGGARVR